MMCGEPYLAAAQCQGTRGLYVLLCEAKGRCVCSATTLTPQANPAQRESDCVSWKTRL